MTTKKTNRLILNKVGGGLGAVSPEAVATGEQHGLNVIAGYSFPISQ